MNPRARLAPMPSRTPEDRPTGNLAVRYDRIRHLTEDLCRPLATEDYVVQSMPDASPVKWHLAHTAWFFETFVLTRYLPGYRPFHPLFGFLFNSYYEAAGPRWSRPQRGLLSRPTVAEVYRYRAYVDRHMKELFAPNHAGEMKQAASTVLLGLHHEQQHQELIMTDLKHCWSANPLHPVYKKPPADDGGPPAVRRLSFPEDLVWIGHDGEGFGFDNEFPRHRVFLKEFEIATGLVTNAEYLAFMKAGGYRRPELWLSDGWAVVQARGWDAPLYWEQAGEQWFAITLGGRIPLMPEQPVCHVSYYEADAFARWAGARLPSEAEWETAAATGTVAGNFLDAGRLHPACGPSAEDRGPCYQMYGDVWQWTASQYVGYPGYHPPQGALGEYNGKFMCNQFVLRGASCVTPRSHARRTYRNFFPADARWQFSGLRLAYDRK